MNNIKLLQDPHTLIEIALSNKYHALADREEEDQQPNIENVWNERKQT